jgi:methyl-accepting chemotaxis protein
MTVDIPAPERVRNSYLELTSASENLNKASDELGSVVYRLDEALQKLNLGVSAWVTIAGDEDVHGNFWSRDLGYSRVKKTWGIALRDIAGNESVDEMSREEYWLFNDAPRWLRIEAVAHIPELIDKLVKQANETAERITKKTAEAQELVSAINIAVTVSKSTKQTRDLASKVNSALTAVKNEKQK